jgi:hypothetical protein
MKTLGRIFIILFAFVLLSGLMVVAVNAAGVNQPNLNGNGGRTEFRPQGGEEGGLPFRPEGGREGGERGGSGVSRLIFGAVKNIGVIAVLAVLIAWPRSIAKNKKRTTTTVP